MIADKLDAEYSIIAHQYTAQPITVLLSGSTNRSAELPPGIYSLISTTACHFRQGGSTVNATTADHYLPANLVTLMAVDSNAAGYVAGIQASAGGTLFIHPYLLGQP